MCFEAKSTKFKNMLYFVPKSAFTLAHKKRQATYITPLRPSTLAAFPPWGNSTGAGCVGLAGCKYTAIEH